MLLDEQNALRNKVIILEDSIKTMRFDIEQVVMDQNEHHVQHSEEESKLQRDIDILKNLVDYQVNEGL